MTVLDILKTFNRFSPDLKSSSEVARKMSSSLWGTDFTLNYEPYKNLGKGGLIMSIEGFSKSAREIVFEENDELISVENYYKKKYNINLMFPELMTVMAKGENEEVFHFPPEVIVLCSPQKVTEERMIHDEKKKLSNWFHTAPDSMKRVTDEIVKKIVDDSRIPGIRLGDPLKTKGIVLESPKIIYQDELSDARSLTDWVIAFVRNENIQNFPEYLLDELSSRGITADNPTIGWIYHDDCELVFKRAKMKNKRFVLFVVDKCHYYNNKIQRLEYVYGIPALELDIETARAMVSEQHFETDIVHEMNLKLGGWNHIVESKYLEDPKQLVIAINISEKSKKNQTYPITVGFSANIAKHSQKFIGGFSFASTDQVASGSIISQIVSKSISAVRVYREMVPNKIVIYFDGIAEDQYKLVDVVYEKSCEKAFDHYDTSYNPELLLIAVNDNHSERFYNTQSSSNRSLPSGTVIDHTVVSPVFDEFYHVAPFDPNENGKATKYTVVYSSVTVNMGHLEQLTNDLCYAHQMEFQSSNVPVPVQMARNMTQAGIQNLADNNGPVYSEGELDLYATNSELGYGSALFGRL